VSARTPRFASGHWRRGAAPAAAAVLSTTVVFASLGGCAGRNPRAGAAEAKRPPAELAADAKAAPGISILRWYVPADPAARRHGLDGLVASGAATPLATPLAAHGVLLYRTTPSRLPEFATALGGAGAGSRRLSLGRATDFGELLSLSVARGTPVLAEGRPTTTPETLLRLELRGWCFPTVDAAAARIELRLVEEDARLSPVAIDPSRVRAEPRELRRGLHALELLPGEILVLVDQPVAPPDDDEDDPLGAALPPPSRAALLFGTCPIPDRVAVLVILPEFGDMLPGAELPQVPAEVPAPPE